MPKHNDESTLRRPLSPSERRPGDALAGELVGIATRDAVANRQNRVGRRGRMILGCPDLVAESVRLEEVQIIRGRRNHDSYM